MQTIPLRELSIVFIPTAFLLAIMFRWQLKAWVGLYANFRMILQLLLVGYFLTYLFETTQPIIIIALVVVGDVDDIWFRRYRSRYISRP